LIRFEMVPATEAHARELALTMRMEDAREVMASAGWTPLQALLESLKVSDSPKTLLVDGSPAAIWGVMPVDLVNGVGAIWLLTGDAVNRWPMAFLRRCRAEVRRLHERWPVLVNAIDARYETACRWAFWLGFDVEDPAPMPGAVTDLPFRRIELRGIHHV
jgi:hypothetical protein